MPDKHTVITYFSCVLAFLSTLTFNQWLMIATVTVSIFAAFTNWRHKNKDIDIKERDLTIKLKKLELEIETLRGKP